MSKTVYFQAWIDETVISDFQGNFVLYEDESSKEE